MLTCISAAVNIEKRLLWLMVSCAVSRALPKLTPGAHNGAYTPVIMAQMLCVNHCIIYMYHDDVHISCFC